MEIHFYQHLKRQKTDSSESLFFFKVSMKARVSFLPISRTRNYPQLEQFCTPQYSSLTFFLRPWCYCLFSLREERKNHGETSLALKLLKPLQATKISIFDLHACFDQMAKICTMFGVLCLSVPTNSAANNSVFGPVSVLRYEQNKVPDLQLTCFNLK